MEAADKPRPRARSASRIGEILIRSQRITREQLAKAVDRQTREGHGRLGEHLVALGLVDEKEITELLAQQFGIPVVDPMTAEIPENVARILPATIMTKYMAIPLNISGSSLTIAVADPSDHVAINEIKFLTGYDIRVTVAPHKSIEKAIDRLLDDGGQAYTDVLKKLGTEAELEVLHDDAQGVDVRALERESEDAPVIALVNAIFSDAIKKNASDIHIEPYEKVLRVRFRIDGMLHEIMTPPHRLKNAIVSRIKIMSDLDIAERRLAQDGRIKLKTGPGREVDVRVNIVPVLAGEKVVLRLLDKSKLQLDMAKLGLTDAELELFEDAYTRPYGMILVTGPTGSGKSTTLYAVLNELNKTTVNISTAEDPIEYNMVGINQVHARDDIGRGFAYILRAFLRQDPDIIMVGEVRDFETGEIALKAALTGHLVLSTLHTNDAPSTVARLLNMGFEPFLLSSALNLILAQRLVRRLCLNCRATITIPPDELVALGLDAKRAKGAKIFEPKGCDECSETGYAGRMAIYELLNVDEKLRAEILNANDGGAGMRRYALAAGMRSLRQAALARLLEGLTSIEEVVRVTAPD